MVANALIDLDGLLINSDQLYFEATQQYFRRFDFDFTRELYSQSINVKFRDWITSVVDIGKSGEEIVAEREVIFRQLAQQKLKLQPGAEKFLDWVSSHFSQTALVTSARRPHVECVFAQLPLGSYFDHVITRELTLHGKPDPACYLLAIERLAARPEDCLVFEDGPTGILAAKRAGLRVVVVPNSFVPDDEAYHQADVLLKSLDIISRQAAYQ